VTSTASGAADVARLSAATLGRALAEVPAFDRSPPPVIAHIGVGAFMRAHLGVYADDLCRLGHPVLIRGVSLHSPRAEEQLAPQDCLYTVTERDPERAAPLRVIGSLTSVKTGFPAALEALSAPQTRLVTLTITEKGYDAVSADLERPDGPATAAGVIALALAERRNEGLGAPVVASLDNVLENGSLLRRRVTQLASRLDPALAAWIAEEVAFPCSVVDRMVPTTTEPDLADVSIRLGLVDRGAVVTEHHRSWIMTSTPGLPPLDEVGVQLVDDIAPYEQRKLWLLNGPHSALAYCGLLAGCATIAAAAEDAVVAAFVRRLVDDVLEVARLPASVQPEAFALDALRRFRNPNLGHTCAKVAADGSRKLPERFASVVASRLAMHLDVTRFATVVALWIAALAGLRITGASLPPVEDPAAGLGPAASGRDLRRLAHEALHGAFDERFEQTVAVALDALMAQGMRTIEEQG